jgi:hypothetical protein
VKGVILEAVSLNKTAIKRRKANFGNEKKNYLLLKFGLGNYTHKYGNISVAFYVLISYLSMPSLEQVANLSGASHT